jgi:hypothetical protein
MNKHDRDNYLFLMSLTPEQFDEWFMTIDEDDVKYAMELIQMARSEIAEQLASLFDDVVELSDARDVLDKFTLNGIK